MRSRGMVERVITVRRQLYGVLLVLGVAGLFNLLLGDMQTTIFGAGSIPVAGELPAKMTPLTQGPSMDGFGSWSPDGKEIAFMRDGQILITDPTGKKVRVLTSEPEQWDADPAWRSDGKALSFIRLSMDGDQSQVMLMELATKKVRSVARESSSIGYLAWSRDGKALYYTTRDRLMKVDLASGKAEKIYTAAQGWEMLSGGLAVSPDGKSVYFGGGPRGERGVQYDLYRMDLPAGKPQQVTTGGGIMPTLDPTGRLLIYRNPREQTGIYLMNLATKAAERVVADEPKAMYFHPNLSPDGKRLVLSRLLLAPPPKGAKGSFTSNLYLHTLEASGGRR